LSNSTTPYVISENPIGKHGQKITKTYNMIRLTIIEVIPNPRLRKITTEKRE